MTTTITLSYHDARQGGLYTSEIRTETPTGTRGQQRRALMAELQDIHARRDPTLHSAGLTTPDGTVSASLFRDPSGTWLVVGHLARARRVVEVLA